MHPNQNDLDLIGVKIFTEHDQKCFSEISGDLNPNHVFTPEVELKSGHEYIVYGVNLLLSALEFLMAFNGKFYSQGQIRFYKPTYLHEEIKFYFDSHKEIIKIYSKQILLVNLSLKRPVEVIFNNRKNEDAVSKKFIKPLEPTFEQCLINKRKAVKVNQKHENIAYLYPALSAVSGSAVIMDMAKISYVVGMECPGLNSVIGSISYSINDIDGGVSEYSVIGGDNFYKNINIEARLGYVSTKISTFYKDFRFKKDGLNYCQNIIKASEFDHVNALVIGGSSGLGEFVAKIIARGGGQVTVTYNTGEIRAKIIQSEIREFDGNCNIEMMDVRSMNEISPTRFAKYNQIYYFPSGKIFGKRGNFFDFKKLTDFYEVYVYSFALMCEKLSELNESLPRIFYPSTVAIDEGQKELSEYRNAKLAGENLCKELEGYFGNIFLVERLPKIETNQTMSIVKTEFNEPGNILLDIVRRMNKQL